MPARARPPWFMLVAGPNGAGKSTFSQNAALLRELIKASAADEIEIINPDTVTRAIQRKHPKISLEAANLAAAKECERRVRSLIERRSGNFVIETVLSTDKYKKIVERARKLKWKVLFVYVTLPSVKESARRVAHRVRKGGHDVPRDKILARWAKSHDNIQWFWARASASFLVLNPPKFAQPRLLASRQSGHLLFAFGRQCAHAREPVLRAAAAECRLAI